MRMKKWAQQAPDNVVITSALLVKKGGEADRN